MINKNNYYDKIKGIDFSKLDERLTEGRDFVDELTENGSNWSLYDSEPEIKESVDLYFQELSKVIKKTSSNSSSASSEKLKLKANQYYIDLYHERMASLDYDTSVKAKQEFEAYTEKEKQHFFEVLLANESSDMAAEEVSIPFLKKEVKYLTSNNYHNSLKNKKSASNQKTSQPKKRVVKKPRITSKSASATKQETGKPVETYSEEIKFIKRFLNLDGRIRNRNHFRLLINAIQRAIRERKIRKSSPYAKEIMAIQDVLIQQYESFKNDAQEIQVDIPAITRKKYERVIGEEHEMLSIKLIKSYISLQGRIIENIKAARLLDRIKNSIKKGKLSKRDRYYDKIAQIKSSLESFVKKNNKQGVLKIENQALNGLRLILNDSAPAMKMIGHSDEPAPLNIDRLTQDYHNSNARKSRRFYMKSTDLQRESFKHIGLTGKWYDFIGDPEVGFRAMVSGQPKMGKSFLMIEFAGELADKHGPVLYVAKEEGKSATLKEKLTQTNAAHPNMIVSDYIPENLHEFQFVFFDSVTKLGLSPENLIAINRSYPGTSFIEIHQVTKQGSARGKNDFAHDPDVLIHIPEKGRAIQNGRYNQGGSLRFFKRNVA